MSLFNVSLQDKHCNFARFDSHCTWRFGRLLNFQVCLSGTMGSDVLSRHRRTWIIRSFSIEEADPGPYPYVLDKVSAGAESTNTTPVPRKSVAVTGQWFSLMCVGAAVSGLVFQINIKRDDKVYFDLYGQGVDEEPRGVFSMDTETGTLYAHQPVDYEQHKMLKVGLTHTSAHRLCRRVSVCYTAAVICGFCRRF